MGEASFILLGATLLSLLGGSNPVKKDCMYIHRSKVLAIEADGENWTQVDFTESVLEHLRDNCNRSFFVEKTTDRKLLLSRLCEEQEKCKLGYKSIKALSEGQRTSLIELYSILNKEEEAEEEKTESTSFRRDVDDYLDYSHFTYAMDLLRHNDLSSADKSELLLLEPRRQRPQKLLASELHSLSPIQENTKYSP